MYKTVVLWIGLPGSGKTYCANKFCDVVVDDITDLDQLPSDEELGISDLGITDVNFCDEFILGRAHKKLKEIYPTRAIYLHYFENDPEQCRANVVHRNDGRNVEGTINRFSEIYKPPASAEKVWKEDIQTMKIKVWMKITDCGDGSSNVELYSSEAKAMAGLDEDLFEVDDVARGDPPCEVISTFIDLSEWGL